MQRVFNPPIIALFIFNVQDALINDNNNNNFFVFIKGIKVRKHAKRCKI